MSMRHCWTAGPSSWWVLLLYVHVILARATSAPQTTATVLTGSSEDPCSSWSPSVPTKQYPVLDVIWPEKEVPLSKQQVSWEPKRIQLSEAGCEHRVGGRFDLGVYLQPAKKHQPDQLGSVFTILLRSFPDGSYRRELRHRQCRTSQGLGCNFPIRFPYFSILYWLGNGSFIEHLPGRLKEGHTSREHRNTSTWLHRALVLEELSPTLRSTNFSCLFVDPGQVAQYHIILAQLWDGLKTAPSPSQETLSSHSPVSRSARPGVA